jgi:CRP/FNR family transcriptional regulator
MPDPSDLLARVPLLHHLAPLPREAVVRAGTPRRLRRGEVLFREGDRAEAMYALLSGVVKLVRTGDDGRETMLHLVHPGESFAEAALFGDEGYPATAQAVEPGEVWCLSRVRLLDLVRASPDLALALLAAVSRWTRRLADKLELLTRHRVEERLAAFLLGRAVRRPVSAGDEIPLVDPRHLIAAQIGTAPEVLSRTLRRLAEEGIATFSRRAARVLDPARLVALAGARSATEPPPAGPDP